MISHKQLSSTLGLVLLAILLLDLSYSFIAYYNTPLQGDLVAICMPTPGYAPILESPLGIKRLMGMEYASPNRFLVYWGPYTYFNYFPLFLQNFCSPINSLYLSTAIIKIITQIAILILMSRFLLPKKKLFSLDSLFIMVLLTVFFQYERQGHYYSIMGIINSSVIYSISYSTAFLFVLLYTLPFYKAFIKGSYNFSIFQHISLFLLAFLVIFNGPVNGPSILIIVLLIFLFNWFYHFKNHPNIPLPKRFVSSIFKIHKNLWIQLGWIFILALYGFYLGSFNTENPENMSSLLKHYQLLGESCIQFFLYGQSLSPFLIISLGILINLLVLKWQKVSLDPKMKTFYIFLFSFSILYLLLLPLGGYRHYRPQIIRMDVILPVTLNIIFIYISTAYYLIKKIKHPLFKTISWGLPLSAIIYFSVVDQPNLKHSQCERQALELLSKTQERNIIVPNCSVLSWHPIKDKKQSGYQAAMLYRWNVTEKPVWFHSE